MTRDAASFDSLYRNDADPWNYETSVYEGEKYSRSLALLPRRRYTRGLEVGCSIGVMSAALAGLCESLLAIDFAPTAIARARERDIPNARFEVAAIPEQWPEGEWDVIVLSEVLYYLEPDVLNAALDRVSGSLRPGGCCLCVGYTGATETVLTASGVEERLLRRLSKDRVRHAIYRDRHPKWIAAAFECRMP